MKHSGRLIRSHLFALVLGLGTAIAVHADTVSVAVPNFSFETPSTTGDTISRQGGASTNTSKIQDWTFTTQNDSNTGINNYSTDPDITGGTGNQGAFMDTYYEYYNIFLTSGNASNNDGTTAGTTGYVTNILADTTYTLTVAVGIPTSYTPLTQTGGWLPHFNLNLLDSSGNVVANTSILYFTLSQGSLEDESVTFTTGATPSDLGEGLQIQFDVQNGDHDSSNGGVVLDDVRLTESGPNIVAPEPSTWAMLLLGAGGLLFLARRKLNA